LPPQTLFTDRAKTEASPRGSAEVIDARAARLNLRPWTDEDRQSHAG
jgi:hypothetical protein